MMRSAGEECVVQRACSTLAAVAAACLGPHGRAHALQASPGAPAGQVASISGLVLGGILHVHPAAALLVKSSGLAQYAQYGDGGLACAFLACRLVDAALEVAKRNSQLHEVCQALMAASSWCDAALDWSRTSSASTDPWVAQLTAPCTSVRSYMAIARGVLAPKLGRYLSVPDLERLSLMVVEALVRGLPPACSGSDGMPGHAPRVECEVVHGMPFSGGKLVDGLVMSADAVISDADALRLPKRHAVIAIFATALDVQEANSISCRVQSAGAQQAGSSAMGIDEAAAVRRACKLLERVCQGGVNVLACQQSIHPAVQAWLRKRGIIPMQRLGAARIAPLCRLSGCLPITTMALEVEPGVAYRGNVDLELQEYGGRSLVAFTPSRTIGHEEQAGYSTIVIGCMLDAVAEQLLHAVKSACKLLSCTATQAAHATPGGGAVELALAAELRRLSNINAEHMTAVQVSTIESYADALTELGTSVLPKGCARIGTHDPVQQHKLSSAPNLCRSQACVRPASRRNVDNCNILDSALCKRAALRRAVETAVAVLRASAGL